MRRRPLALAFLVTAFGLLGVSLALAGNPNEREVLRLRYGLDRGEPRTLDEVGDHFRLTRERIRQIEARAMSKLRHPSTDRGARELLTG